MKGAQLLNALFFTSLKSLFFQSEDNSNDSFIYKVLKLIINIAAALLLAGCISFVSKVSSNFLLHNVMGS